MASLYFREVVMGTFDFPCSCNLFYVIVMHADAILSANKQYITLQVFFKISLSDLSFLGAVGLHSYGCLFFYLLFTV